MQDPPERVAAGARKTTVATSRIRAEKKVSPGSVVVTISVSADRERQTKTRGRRK